MKKTCIAAVLASLMSVTAAQAGFFKSKLDVNPISRTNFEVVETQSAGPNQYWCAASYYASRTLGKNSGRIYLSTPHGPAVTAPGYSGASFSTEPISGVNGRATNSITEVGANLTVAHALQFCRDNIIEPSDR